MKKLRVTVEGKTYEVLVEILDEPSSGVPASPLPTAVLASTPVAPTAPAPTPAPAKSAASAPGDVVSPLAGKIVSIDVKIGQSVTEGAQVATIEAMKMNTFIYAPKAGTVTAILVNPGDGVEEGAVLLRLA